ncbi:MAG: DUF354 domain-containing protein [Bacteroidales bacterium]|nr:DUF354 domain-containing protein [Bacteroidales bacterium]
MNKKIWYDIINPPHVHLLTPIINKLTSVGYEPVITVKDFAETATLFSSKGMDYKLLGSYSGNSKSSIVGSKLKRYKELYKFLPDIKCSIACGHEAGHISFLKRKPSILFLDNDISPIWLYKHFVSSIFCPFVIKDILIKKSPDLKEKLISYNGFKEDLYLANYFPDPNFLKDLPFNDFVTIRPENLKANYVKGKKESIVPDLIKELSLKGVNILLLPRYKSDYYLARKYENIYIPSESLNGLDVCYYSKAVLTGAGTFAREAALMGKPAVSFYAGEVFLSVDTYLIKQEKIFFSRNVGEIADYITNLSGNSDVDIDLTNSKVVFNDMIEKLKNVISNF